MPVTASEVRPGPFAGPWPDERLGPGHAALVGAVSGAIVVGSGLLASRLLGAVTGRGATAFVDGTPTWLWWLSLTLVEMDPAQAVAIASLVVVVVSAVGGLLSRTRPWAGLLVLALLGLAAAYLVWSSEATWLDLLVPGVATVAGWLGFWVLWRVGRRPATGHGPTDGPDGSRRRTVSRRRALLAGALVAVGAGIGGAAVEGAPAAVPRRRFATGPRAGGGDPLLRGTVVNVRDLGAVGDGRTDDAAAIRSAMDAANAAGGTLFFPAGDYLYPSSDPLLPASGVTVSGVPGSSTVSFTSDGTAGFVFGCIVEADDVTIDGLVLRRAGDFESVLLATGAFRRFTFSRSSLVGNVDTFAATCHGIKFGDAGTAIGLHLVDSTITTMDYGLLQTNLSTLSTTDVLVERCSFTGNRNTDLEFNSPSGVTRQVRVQDCAFSDNDSPGFGVGLANVQDVVVRGNTFDSYAMEAVHIEDYSSGIVVEANEFVACGLRMHSHVQIIAGAREIQVIDNTFLAGMNSNEIYVVTAQPGGSGLAVSGREIVPPSDVALRDNFFECSGAVTPVYFQGTTGSSITGSTVVGPDMTGPADAFDLPDSLDTLVEGNAINGRRY